MKAVLALAALLSVSACTGDIKVNGKPIGGAQPHEAQERSVSDFTRIDSAGSADVRVFVGPETSVEVRAPQDVLDKIETVVEDDTLRVRTGNMMFSSGPIVVTVTTPKLTAVAITGSGDLDATGLTGEAFELHSSGSGDAELEGEVKTLTAKTSGSGDLEAVRLKVQDATIRSSGSGDVELHASGRVEGRTSGSGDIEVEGGATCDVSSSGSGDVDC